jgi:hypothetical protein
VGPRAALLGRRVEERGCVAPNHPTPVRAREATTDRHLGVVGAKPPRSTPIRPPLALRGLEAGWEVLTAP